MQTDDLAAATARLGSLVERRRRDYGLTQPELAALAGVSERSIRAVETGKTTARLDIVIQILFALSIPIPGDEARG